MDKHIGTGTNKQYPSLLVIPSFNDSNRLRLFLEKIAATNPKSINIKIVDDGSEEEERLKTKTVITEIASLLKGSSISYMENNMNMGKGYSIRKGWASRGNEKILAFCDADGSAPFEEFLRLKQILENSPRIGAVLATRSNQQRYHKRGAIRASLSYIFTKLINCIFKIKTTDTQCGLKLIRTQEYSKFESQLEEDRFLFDLELILKCKRLGVNHSWEPIKWKDTKNSKVKLASDPLNMLISLLRLKLKNRRENCLKAPKR